MFESNRQRDSEITLCLFPHLAEFIVVDTRKNLPDGPAVRLLSFDEIFTEEFMRSVETGFSALIRRKGIGLMEIISVPQEVEALIRAESMKRVIQKLDSTSRHTTSGAVEGIGVLFFTRGLLSIQPDQVEVAMRELFGSALLPGQMGMLKTELVRLIEAEKKAEEGAMQNEVSRLITDKGGPFLTLWENRKGKG